MIKKRRVALCGGGPGGGAAAGFFFFCDCASSCRCRSLGARLAVCLIFSSAVIFL